jgi:hypothetical protein
MELIGLYLVASALLIGAGVAKAREPGDTARALAASLPGQRRLDWAVRIAATGEAILGAAALLWPRPPLATLIAASYVVFALYVAYVRHRHGVLATCGCFGQPDTPATRLHIVVNLVLAAGALGVALHATSSATLTSTLAAQPWHGVPLVFASLAGLWLTYLALARLSSLTAVRRQVAEGATS